MNFQKFFSDNFRLGVLATSLLWIFAAMACQSFFNLVQAQSDLPKMLVRTTTTKPESEGTHTVWVELSKASSKTVTAKIIAQSLQGGATSGLDFEPFFRTVKFQPGERYKQYTLNLINDFMDEGNERYRLVTFAAQNATVVNPVSYGEIPEEQPLAARIQLIPDDGEQTPVASSFEEGEAVDVSVSLSRPFNKEVSVRVATRSVTAEAGVDFYGTYTLVRFAPGETHKIAKIQTIKDDIEEGEERFTVALRELSGGLRQSDGPMNVLLYDKLPFERLKPEVGVHVARGAIFPVDEGQAASVQIILNQKMPRPVTVGVATRRGTAVPGKNFYGFYKKVTIPVGRRSVYLRIPTLYNSVVEDDKTFFLRIVDIDDPAIAGKDATTRPIIIRDIFR